jgi:hypothetical protein
MTTLQREMEKGLLCKIAWGEANIAITLDINAKLKPTFSSWTNKAPFVYNQKQFWTSVSIVCINEPSR